MTVLELITSSLRLIGQLAPGRGIVSSGSEATAALFILNAMLDSWNTERLAIYATERATFPLVASQSSYTIGTNGNFNTTRPVRIERAGCLLSDIELELQVFNLDQWAGIELKASTSAIPFGVYYNPTYPLGTLQVWPVPDEVNTIVLYLYQQLLQISNPTATLSVPPGYADAIRYNLAVRLAPEWGKQPRQDVMNLAVDSLAKIKSANLQVPLMSSDQALLYGNGWGLAINLFGGSGASTSNNNGNGNQGSTAVYSDGETPGGAVDGANTVFTFAHTPTPAASLQFFLNGVVQNPGVDFSLSGATATFLSGAPLSGDVLKAWYRY